MKQRYQLFEFCDQQWLPIWLKEAYFEILHFVLQSRHQSSLDKLVDIIKEKNITQVIDFGGGCGKIWEIFFEQYPELKEKLKVIIYEKHNSIKYEEKLCGKKIDSPEELNKHLTENTIVTFFSSFHHLRPNEIMSLFLSFKKLDVSFFIVEVLEKSILQFFMIGVSTLLLYGLHFMIQPIKLSRIILTNIFPITLLMYLWDGWVSILRQYDSKGVKKYFESVFKEERILNFDKSIDGVKMIWS